MPGTDRPLNRHEIAQVLHGITDAPPTIPPAITRQAISATVTGLSLWCDLEEVELAQVSVQPRPSLHRFLA